MKKHPFLVFTAVISALVISLIVVIQSPSFARLVQKVVIKYLPRDMGIEGDFSDFKIELFPPGFSIRNPRLKFRKENIVHMPEGSVSAEKLALRFRPFQALSGNIRVHEASLVNGEVSLTMDRLGSVAMRSQKKALNFGWDELLQIRSEAISLENTRVHLRSNDETLAVDFSAETLRIAQWQGTGGMGYSYSLSLKDLRGGLLKVNSFLSSLESIQSIQANGHVNALGIELESLNLSLNGMQAAISGSIKGNILLPKSLVLDASIKAQAELAQAIAIAGSDLKMKGSIGGKVDFDGKIRGAVLRPETFHAEGVLTVAEPRFRTWSADLVRMEGAWSAGNGAGAEIILNKGLIAAHEQTRSGGLIPGGGGKIEIGATRFPLLGSNPIQIPLVLDRAHIHWLGALALKDVYPLDFRVSGPVTATLLRKSKGAWKVTSKVSLKVQDFELNNQKLGVQRPLHRVFKIPQIQIDGNVDVDQTGIFPATSLILPASRVLVTGKIDFKTGYDLKGDGAIHLQDIGQIAENDIRGDGLLHAWVHGPSSRCYVDFDTDVRGAFYLNLNLGDVKGRMTWDDDPSHLLFQNVQAKKGKTIYVVDGKLDLKNDIPALKVHSESGNIQDFVQLFSNLTRDLWWYPQTISGPVSGDISVTGGLSLQKLKVFAHLDGTNWEYFGEHFSKLALQGGYDEGRYFLSDAQIRKRNGKISGKISFDQYDRTFNWQLRTADFSLTDLDHIARLDIPIRGKVIFETEGYGKDGVIKASTQALVTDLVVRGAGMPPSQLTLSSEAGKSLLKASAFGGQGTLEMVYDFTRGAPSSLHAEAKQLDFSPILLILNSKSMQDIALVGTVSGSAQLGFPQGDLNRVTGKIEVSDYVLAHTGSRFQLEHPFSARSENGSFHIEDVTIRGDQGSVQLYLDGADGRLDGLIHGDVDLSILGFLTPTITGTSGTADLNFDIGGTVSRPAVVGKSYIHDGNLRVVGLESPFENMTGTVELKQNILNFKNFEADLAGGRVLGEGSATLFTDRVPTIELKSTLTGNKIKVYPFQFVKVKGDLRVHGDQLPYQVEGGLVVESALTQKKFFEKQKESLKAIRYLPMPSSQSESDYPMFRLNINAAADNGIFIKNDLFDAEAKCKVTIVNTLEMPRIIGTAELVQGKMIFKDRSFQIQSASAEFDSPTEINPSFHLTGITDVNGTKVQLYAAGRMSNGWKIDLSSTPAMPEYEILSLLALGTDSKRLKAGDRSVVEQGEAASLLLHSLDFNREVQDKTGLQIELDESVNPQIGTSAFRPQTQLETSVAPRIVIKKQVGNNVELSYGSTVGVGTGSEKGVNAEVKVTPGFSVIGVWDNRETVDTQNTPLNTSSYGMDLKVQKRFK